MHTVESLIFRNNIKKNGLKAWSLSYLHYKYDHLLLNNRFLKSCYLTFTNGFEQKKQYHVTIYITLKI